MINHVAKQLKQHIYLRVCVWWGVGGWVDVVVVCVSMLCCCEYVSMHLCMLMSACVCMCVFVCMCARVFV